MISVAIQRWAAWAPGLERREDWERWSLAPAVLTGEECPDARFLPSLLRRRCSRLSRLMLHVAYACGADGDLSTPATVFASRHGEATSTVPLLEALAREQPLTAAGFSHSVHNAPAGLFSIAAKNHQISSALAAGADTFPCAFLETLAILQREPDRPVLLVVADEPLHPLFSTVDREPRVTHAVAFIVGQGGDGIRIRCTLGRSSVLAQPARWPQVVEFLRWLLSEEPSLTLGTGALTWTWTRD
jgi:hypothetical protein